MSALDVVNGPSKWAETVPPSREPDGHQKPYVFIDCSSTRTERRTSARFPLAVLGELVMTPTNKVPLRVTSGSSDAFFACSPQIIEMDTPVIVELNMLGSYRLRIPARVVRATDRGFAVQLDPDPRTISYRAAFWSWLDKHRSYVPPFVLN